MELLLCEFDFCFIFMSSVKGNRYLIVWKFWVVKLFDFIYFLVVMCDFYIVKEEF